MIKNYFRILKKTTCISSGHPKSPSKVKGTRYLVPIHFCNIRTQKMSKLKMRKKVIKNYFRFLKNPHAYLQTILKAPVKFQKDRTKPVGGIKGTRYLLKFRNYALRTTERRKQCPSAFLRKGGGQLGYLL